MGALESLQYGAYHIANNKVEYNPQRKNNFTLVIQGLNGILRVGSADGSQEDADKIANGQQEIILGLKACSTPSFSQGQIDIKRGNSTIKFPGKPTFNDIEIEAYDFIGSNIKDTLLAWQNQCYNTKYDYIGDKSSYKKSCTLYEYTPSGDPVRYWDIKGAWPKAVTVDGFSMDDEGAAVVKATLVIDWAEMHLPDGE